MSTTLAYFFACVVLTEASHAVNSPYPIDLEDWVVGKPVDHYDIVWSHLDRPWSVALRAGRPSARTARLEDQADDHLPFEIEPGTFEEGLAGRRICTRVEDGWIVSFNAGEWGACLWWFSEDGQRRRKISTNKYSVNDFLQTSVGLLAVDGIAHGFPRGGIIRIVRRADGLHHAELFFALNDAAYCGRLDRDGRLVVATTSRLLRIDLTTKRMETLIEGASWDYLQPDAMLIAPDGCIYLGMMNGVARFRPKPGKPNRLDRLIPYREYDREREAHRGVGFH